MLANINETAKVSFSLYFSTKIRKKKTHRQQWKKKPTWRDLDMTTTTKTTKKTIKTGNIGLPRKCQQAHEISRQTSANTITKS
jgi:hypothetical protein